MYVLSDSDDSGDSDDSIINLLSENDSEGEEKEVKKETKAKEDVVPTVHFRGDTVFCNQYNSRFSSLL